MKKMIRTGRMFLSVMLAMAMILTAWGNPVLAEASAAKESGTADVAADATGADSPVNPVHICTKSDNGSDKTEWSYIYFGSYPQTEVTGSALTAAITGASYNADGDAWVNGIKYRRISRSDTNDSTYFGSSAYRYFKWERIRWRVLQNNGNTLFVAADQGLDCKAYHDSGGSITWENSTLRSWLNSVFYSMAFSSSEQSAIEEQAVINEKNPEYGTGGGNHTQDKIYLLSLNEATNPEYGFCETYNTHTLSRHIKASDYAHIRGAYTGAEGDYADNCWWWLRSPGGDSDYAAVVTEDGEIDRIGSSIRDNSNACAPVLHISLESERWYPSDDGTSGAGGEDGRDSGKEESVKSPVHHCTKVDDGSDYTEWSYLYFGSYPQAEVIGSELTDKITGASYNADGDAWVDGIKYRRISENDANNTNYFGDSAYRYFKWQRICWRVLQKDGDTLFLMADQGLDCKDYHDPGGFVTWENCTLRNWLNSDFYYTAFSSEEQSAVSEQTITNEDNPDYGTTGGNTTKDRIFLLSIGDVENPEYGFCESTNTSSLSRWIKASDYAHARGASTNTTSSYAGNCWWWLRSPGTSTGIASSVDNIGDVYRYGNNVSSSDGACAPALRINLSSDLWYLADDGTSGLGGEDEKYNTPLTVNGAFEDEVFRIEQGLATTTSYHIVASGGNPSAYTYQWYYAQSRTDAGTKIEGETSDYFAMSSANGTLLDGYYYCVVSDGVYEVSTPPFKVTVIWETPEPVPVTSISLSKTALTLKIGESEELSAKIQPEDATEQDIVWSVKSSDSSVIALETDKDSTRVTAIREGTAIITAEAGGKTASCTVTVTAKDSPTEPDVQKKLTADISADQNVRAGTAATFSVTAGGGETMDYSYQWYSSPTSTGEGIKIDGAVFYSYTIPAGEVTMNLNGYFYYCVVRNGSEEVTSSRAKLTVSNSSEHPGDSSGSTGGNEGSGTIPGDSSGNPGGNDGSGTTSGGSSGSTGGNSGTTSGGSSGNTGGNGGTTSGGSSGSTGGNSGTTSGGSSSAAGISAGNGTTGSGATSGSASTAASVKLTAPKLKVKLSTVTAVKLTWNKISGASGYIIYRATSKKGKYQKIGTATGTSYTSKKLKGGKTYYYKVAAYRGNETGPMSGIVSKLIPKKPATPKQKKIQITASKGQFTISWNKIKNAQKIEILRRVDNGKYKKWKTVSAKKGKVSYSYRSYERNHKYSFMLRAYYTKEKVKIYSGYSNVYTIVM